MQLGCWQFVEFVDWLLLLVGSLVLVVAVIVATQAMPAKWPPPIRLIFSLRWYLGVYWFVAESLQVN